MSCKNQHIGSSDNSSNASSAYFISQFYGSQSESNSYLSPCYERQPKYVSLLESTSSQTLEKVPEYSYETPSTSTHQDVANLHQRENVSDLQKLICTIYIYLL